MQSLNEDLKTKISLLEQNNYDLNSDLEDVIYIYILSFILSFTKLYMLVVVVAINCDMDILFKKLCLSTCYNDTLNIMSCPPTDIDKMV